MSKIDVVIPCYKYAHYLRQCVESILAQRGVDLRVVIVDDASPDNTPEVAAELVREDRRVEYRRHEINRGFIATANESLGWLAADYALLISADDVLAPGALHRATTLLDAHPEVGLAYGKIITFHGEPPVEEAARQPDGAGAQILSSAEALELFCQACDCVVPAVTAVVRTSVHRRLGWFRNELLDKHDMEVWLRYAAHGPVAALDAVQALWRIHGDNMHLTLSKTALTRLGYRRMALDYFFADYGPRLADRQRLHDLGRRQLAEQALEEAWVAMDRRDVGPATDLMAFAASAYPPVRSYRMYSRLRWRRRLGPGFYSLLRRLAGRARVGS